MLLPSLWYENAPVTIIEAAAYGLGLVASRIGGIPEFVEEGSTGFLCKAGDVDDLRDMLTQIASRSRSLKDFRERSAVLASRFDVASMTDKYLQHYESMTAKEPA